MIENLQLLYIFLLVSLSQRTCAAVHARESHPSPCHPYGTGLEPVCRVGVGGTAQAYQPSKPRLHRTWDGRGGGWNTRRHNMHFPVGAFSPSQPTTCLMAYFIFPKTQFYCLRIMRLRIMKKRVLQGNRASLWLRSSRETISRSRKSWETSAVAGGKRIGQHLPREGAGLSLAQPPLQGAALRHL